MNTATTPADGSVSAPQPGRRMRCLRLFGTFLVLMWFVFAVLVLGLRWVVLPQVGAYRAEIAAELSRLSAATPAT